jgi:hypothetical protein
LYALQTADGSIGEIGGGAPFANFAIVLAEERT